MRTARSGRGRVPGFPDASATASQPIADATPAATSEPARRSVELDQRAGTRQLNVRVLTPLLGRYKRMLRELEDDGFKTNLTEIVHALLLEGPSEASELRDAVRAYRRTLDDS